MRDETPIPDWNAANLHVCKGEKCMDVGISVSIWMLPISLCLNLSYRPCLDVVWHLLPDKHCTIPDMICIKIRSSELLFPSYFLSRLYISMDALLFCVMLKGPSPTLNIRCVIVDVLNVQFYIYIYIFTDCMCMIIYWICSCCSSTFFQLTCLLASRNWGFVFPLRCDRIWYILTI